MTRRGKLTAASAVVLVGLAMLLITQPAGAAAGLDPLAVAQVQRANCQLLAAHSTGAQRTRANQCVTDQNVIIALLTPATPTPTATATATPVPTTMPPTTSPPTTPPASPSPSPSPTPPTTTWPDASNTGVPAGTVLVAHPGHITITMPGAVISGWDISGGVEIKAAGVTLRNSRIRCAGEGICVSVGGGLTGVVIDHNDIGLDSGFGQDPQGINVYGKGAATSVVMTRNHIHNVGDGVRMNGAATFTDNLVELLDPDDGHGDGIQAEEGPNVVIRHNTIGAGNTSSILINDGTDENNWTIDNNRFVWGEHNNYVIHFRAASCPARNCVFSNNVVVHPFPPGVRFVANAWPTPDAAHWFVNSYSDGGAIPVP